MDTDVASLAWATFYAHAAYLQLNDRHAYVWVAAYAVPALLATWTFVAPRLAPQRRRRCAIVVATLAATSAASMIAADDGSGVGSGGVAGVAVDEWLALLACNFRQAPAACASHALARVQSAGLALLSPAAAAPTERLREQIGLLVIAFTLPWVTTFNRRVVCSNVAKYVLGAALLIVVVAVLPTTTNTAGGTTNDDVGDVGVRVGRYS